jgi:hypothetical protein
MGADNVPNHIDLDELIACLHKELAAVDRAILTLERMAVSGTAHARRSARLVSLAPAPTKRGPAIAVEIPDRLRNPPIPTRAVEAVAD